MRIRPRKILFISSLSAFLLLAIFFYQTNKFQDGMLHIVFCNVGQGDAIFIRTPKGRDILVDGGPDDKILDCLSSQMPFWDRTLEAVFLSHPHFDHFGGLFEVLRRYRVVSFNTEKLENDSESFGIIKQQIQDKRIPTRYLFKGDRFSFGNGVEIKVLGPSKEFLFQTSPNGIISESEGFANLILLVKYRETSILLTGDSQVAGLKEAVGISNLEVLQVPHHGSRTGLNQELIDILKPDLAVISVGKNRFGHPHKEVLELLEGNSVQIKSTDREGEIEIVSDGKKTRVVKESTP